MARLTARSLKNNMAYLVNVRPNEQEVDSLYPNTLRCIMDCFERLAQYEDTGLEPEEVKAQQQEIEQLKEYKNHIDNRHLDDVQKLHQEIERLRKELKDILRDWKQTNRIREGE